MAIIILLALILGPLIEIAVFIQVGGAIGLWPTLILIVVTALLGTWQLRAQGLATLRRARSQIDRGVMPARELFDGVCLLLAGVLLLVPGFVTDAIGALLFVPALREVLRRVIGRRIAASAETRVFVDGKEVYHRRPGDGVIDGDYRDVTEQDNKSGNQPKRLP